MHMEREKKNIFKGKERLDSLLACNEKSLVGERDENVLLAVMS